MVKMMSRFPNSRNLRWCAAPGLFPSHYLLIYVLFPSHSWWAERCSVRLSRGMVCSSWFISFPSSFNICFISFPFSWWAESCSVRLSTGMGRSRQHSMILTPFFKKELWIGTIFLGYPPKLFWGGGGGEGLFLHLIIISYMLLPVQLLQLLSNLVH
jgi:hypothetical protein